jgi:hypothetical protein
MTRGEWRSLLESFVAGEIDGPAFERRFLDAWRADYDNQAKLPPSLEWLFYEVDAYCAEPEIRGSKDLDDDGLRAATRQALARFDEPRPPRAQPSAPEIADKTMLDDVRRAFARLVRR